MQLLSPGAEASARPLVVLHKDSAPVLKVLTETGSAPFAILYFDFKTDSIVEFDDGESSIDVDIDVDVVPLNTLCGFIATTAETSAHVSRLAARLSERFTWMASLGRMTMGEGEATAEALLRAMATLLTGGWTRLLARNADLAGRAGLARRQFEQLQRTVVDMAQALRAATPDNIVTALEYLPPPTSPTSVVEVGGTDPATCAQRLPTGMRGLAGIDLFHTRATVSPGAPIEARLSSAEDGHVHAVWSIDTKALRGETIRLVLPRGLDTLDLTPVLTLTAPPAALALIRLGAPHPDPAYCCRCGDVALEAPLAMRLRRAMPGRPLAHERGALAPIGGEERDDEAVRPSAVAVLHEIGAAAPGNLGAAERIVEATDLGTVYQLGRTPPDVDFAIVYFWKDRQVAMIHPLVGRTTVACLPGVVAPECSRVTVWMEAVREDGPLVEFAAAVGDDDAVALEALGEGETTGPLLVSGWSRLSPGRTAKVDLFTSPGTGGGTNLYVATRLASGVSSHQHAWVVLRSVQMR